MAADDGAEIRLAFLFDDEHDLAEARLANKTRLDAMRRTQSGFALAEEDLKLRGPGDFFGARQPVSSSTAQSAFAVPFSASSNCTSAWQAVWLSMTV